MRDLRELNINEGGLPVSRAAPADRDFHRLEALAQVTLPGSYKALLRFANGGHPELSTFVVDNQGSEWSVSRFFRVSSDDGPNSVFWALSTHSTVLPARRLPIGQDGGGNLFVLNFDTNPPSVVVVVHDEGFREIPLASSFERFIDGLELDPDAI